MNLARTLLPAALIVAGIAGAALAQEDDPVAALPGNPEQKELVYYSCTACHSFKLVAQQGMSRERWDKLMHWMVEEQGMPEYPPEDWNAILDYLAAHYGQGGGQGGGQDGTDAAPTFAATGGDGAKPKEAPPPDTSSFTPPSPFNTR